MKTTMLSVFLVALLSTHVLAAPPCASPLQNGDFEIGVDSPWVSGYDGGPSSFVVSGPPCFGNYCAIMNHASHYSQQLSVKAGHTYSVELYTRAYDESIPSAFSIYITTVAHQAPKIAILATGIPTSSWALWSGTFVAPADMDVLFVIYNAGDHVDQSIFVDNVKFDDISPGGCPTATSSISQSTTSSSTSQSASASSAPSCPSLLQNGDFETGLFSPSWDPSTFNGQLAIIRKDQLCDGVHCDDYVTEINQGAAISQKFTPTAGHKYSVKLALRSGSSNDVQLTILIGALSTPYVHLYRPVPTKPGEEWSYLSVDYTAATSEESIIYFEVYGDSGASILVDNIVIIDVTSLECGGSPPPSTSSILPSTTSSISPSTTSSSTSQSASASSAPSCPSLLQNGDFETGLFSPSWTPGTSTSSGAVATMLKGQPCDGIDCGDYVTELLGGISITQHFAPIKGHRYSVKLAVRSVPSNDARLPLSVWIGAVSTPDWHRQKLFLTSPSAEWSYLTGIYGAAESEDSVITIELSAGIEAGSVLVDNIAIIDITSLECGGSPLPSTSSSSISASTSSSSTSKYGSASTTSYQASNTTSHSPHGTGYSSYPSHSSNFTASHHGNHPSYTTSTVCTTLTYTITSCAASVTACHVGATTTEVRTLYTTVCPVSNTKTSVAATATASVHPTIPAAAATSTAKGGSVTPQDSAYGASSAPASIKGTSVASSPSSSVSPIVSVGAGGKLAVSMMWGAGVLGLAVFLF